MKIKEFVPTAFQEAFFATIQQENGNILLNAVAGSGKTSTIIHSISKIPNLSAKQVLLVAFNKHIATELSQRQHRGDIPFEVRISTLHALGNQAIGRYNKGYKPRVDSLATALNERIEQYCFNHQWFGVSTPEELTKEESRYIHEYCLLVARLLKYAKITLSLDVQTLSQAVEKFDDYHIKDEHIERAVELISAFYISTKPPTSTR